MKEESEKVGLKLNFQKSNKVMAFGPITSWQIDGETVETVTVFFGGLQKDGDCSHENKKCLLLGRKVMTNLESILKSRDITLPTKFCLIKALVLPVSKTVSHVKTTCLYLHVKTVSTCQNCIYMSKRYLTSHVWM